MDEFQEEFLDYKEAGFDLILTQDKSPTLVQKGLGESMHSMGGALSESIFIYQNPLIEFLSNKPGDFEVLSIGLGLGYNEILTLNAVEKMQVKADFKILTFEKEKILQELFLKRIKNPNKYVNYWSLFELPKTFSNLEFKGVFDEEVLNKLEPKKRFIIFDAYSNKTSQNLWEEDFLESFLQTSLSGSVFTTYASTGVLNRALKKTGFVKIPKPGFKFKRESTYAVKK